MNNVPNSTFGWPGLTSGTARIDDRGAVRFAADPATQSSLVYETSWYLSFANGCRGHSVGAADGSIGLTVVSRFHVRVGSLGMPSDCPGFESMIG